MILKVNKAKVTNTTNRNAFFSQIKILVPKHILKTIKYNNIVEPEFNLKRINGFFPLFFGDAFTQPTVQFKVHSISFLLFIHIGMGSNHFIIAIRHL